MAHYRFIVEMSALAKNLNASRDLGVSFIGYWVKPPQAAQQRAWLLSICTFCSKEEIPNA